MHGRRRRIRQRPERGHAADLEAHLEALSLQVQQDQDLFNRLLGVALYLEGIVLSNYCEDSEHQLLAASKPCWLHSAAF